jgi:hypothetical protein
MMVGYSQLVEVLELWGYEVQGKTTLTRTEGKRCHTPDFTCDSADPPPVAC